MAFRLRSAVQGVPVVGGLSDPSNRRSPVEAMRSVGISFLALAVKERVAAVCCCDGANIRLLII